MHRKTSRMISMAGWMLCLLILLSSCQSNLFQRRTVYVPDGEPVRLRETLEDVKVWVAVDTDGDGEFDQWEPSTMDIPEGWYALSRK